MLLALLLPDPCDPNCSADFRKEARVLLAKVQGEPGAKDIDLRAALLRFIGDFSNWDLSTKPPYLEVGRELVKAAHGNDAPLVVDPFAGGGSIPLEALRLGCDAFASDLNPVACLILKTMLEDIPRHGPKLANELRRVGAEIKKQAEKELAQYYPADPDGGTPIAYLWARTVRCESPNCGAETPLARSFWLCKKSSRTRALKYDVSRPKDKTPHVTFAVFEPKNEKEVPAGSVTRANATCFACSRTLGADRVRAQLRQQRGGADVEFDEHGNRVGGARLLAVVTLKDNASGRQYRVAEDRDYRPLWRARQTLEKLQIEETVSNGLSVIPNEPLPPQGTLGFRVQLYGIGKWGDLFTTRQKLTLARLASLVRPCIENNAAGSLPALAIDKLADKASSLCRWKPSAEYMAGNTFSRQALPIVWDFCEAQPFGGASVMSLK
jgi:putative DNA methylase